MPLLQLLLEGVKVLQMAHLQAAGQCLQYSGLAGQMQSVRWALLQKVNLLLLLEVLVLAKYLYSKQSSSATKLVYSTPCITMAIKARQV